MLFATLVLKSINKSHFSWSIRSMKTNPSLVENLLDLLQGLPFCLRQKEKYEGCGQKGASRENPEGRVCAERVSHVAEKPSDEEAHDPAEGSSARCCIALHVGWE